MRIDAYSQRIKSAIATFCLLSTFSFLSPLHAQENNLVVIKPTDTPADIVRKAAHVVPSARQFNWQRQELTAFLHFGVNTYTGKEWGDGTESATIFNPTALDVLSLLASIMTVSACGRQPIQNIA